MFGRDVATGEVEAHDHYGTEGPLSSWGVKNQVPTERRENICYTYIPTDTCTEEQIEALDNGTAVIEEFIVLDPAGVSYLPEQL
jgi:hypothetical protein